jgi:hypothetical protein
MAFIKIGSFIPSVGTGAVSYGTGRDFEMRHCNRTFGPDLSDNPFVFPVAVHGRCLRVDSVKRTGRELELELIEPINFTEKNLSRKQTGARNSDDRTCEAHCLKEYEFNPNRQPFKDDFSLKGMKHGLPCHNPFS